jgi:4-amino-4-deoxy-L-arabinose transferase-like glycosyltransferase
MPATGKHIPIIIFFAALLVFIPFLGAVHLFDWDEINFAECAREMIVTGDYSRVYIDFKPFWEKPPLFFWLQSISMHIFGINEFAARFPNAVCGIVSLIILYRLGKKLFGKKFGILWALAYGGSLFPNMYFKSGIIDPWFNLFTFLSFYYLILYHWKRNNFDKEGLDRKPVTYAIYAAVFMGLAILTKGPVALLVFLLALSVYLVANRGKIFFQIGHAFLFLFVALSVTFLWYGYETIRHGPGFIIKFIQYQYELFTTHSAGQEGFPGYHFVVILLGCFPASVFAIPAFFKTQYNSRYEKDFKKWMLILFWTVLLLFTITQSRIIHYSSLAWFPVTFLAAYSFYKWERNEMVFRKYTSILIGIIGSLLTLVLLAAPFIARHLDKIIPYVKDEFAKANMQAEVHWSGWESVAGIIMGIAVLTGLLYLAKRKFSKARWLLFSGTALTVFLASAMIVPRAEKYSQNAAIEFFIQRQGEDCYVTVLGYFSYAQLFYTRKEKPVNPNSYNREWLLQGDIDKPVYFVTKVDKIQDYRSYPELKELYRKNGFIFLKRDLPHQAKAE